MPGAPLPPDEARRLQSLHDLDVLDSPAEREFDAIARVAALVCGVPVALVSLVDEDRQWFKANIGLPGVSQTPRNQAFCAYALHGDDILEVTDATLDARFADNTLVTSDPHIRFYAGSPLKLGNGARVRTLCVIDHQPRTLDATQREILKQLAHAAAHALESRRAARAFAESEARFRVFSESAPMGVFATDAAGRCTYTNARWQRIYGMSLEESLGEGWSQTLHPDDRAAVFAEWQRQCERLDKFEMQFRILRKDGSIRHVRSLSRPVIGPDQRVTGHVGSVEDVTDRAQAARTLVDERERLRASEERLRLATNAAELALWQCRPGSSTLAWCNERLYALFGMPPGSRDGDVNELLATFVEPHAAGAFAAALARTGATGEPFHFAGRFRRADDGSLRFVEMSGQREVGPGDTVFVMGTAADMTQRRSVEDNLRRFTAELSEADRRKNEFLATLAHELRNPLAPLRNGLQIMQRSEDAAIKTRALGMMERQLSQLVHLVDDLLDIARVSSGKVELKREIVALESVVAIAVETCAPLIESGQHALHVDVDPSLRVHADPTRLAQVVGNLLGNAAKYTPAGGRIDVVAEQSAGTVEIRVTDTGDGIAADSLSTVFDLFMQLGDDGGRSHGGLGIGLALVRRLVELHGGTVEAHSAGPGRGSTFAVRLPVAPDAPVADSVPTPAVERLRGPLRILVVDDNQDAADSLAMLLGIAGHDATAVYDGEEAVRLAREIKPAVMFLDIGLPGMSGYEVAQALRVDHPPESLFIVALSGWGAESDRSRSKAAGFDRHLTKPVDLTQVSALLASRR